MAHSTSLPQPMDASAEHAPADAVTTPFASTRLVDGLEVEVLTDLAGLESAADDWQALEAVAGPSAVFQSYVQTLISARHFVGEGSGLTLNVVVVRDEGRVRLILPLVLHVASGLEVGRIAGAPLSQYAEVLADPDADIVRLFNAALTTLRRRGVSALELDGVRDDSLLLRAGRAMLGKAADVRVAPFSNLGLAPDHETFVRGRSKDLLKGLRNKRKQMDRAGSVAFELIEGGDAAGEAIAQALDLKRDWLVQRGKISGAFLTAATNSTLRDLAAERPGAIVLALRLHGELAALRFGFLNGGTYFAYLSAYDTRLAKFAPGKLLMDYCLATLRQRGVTTIDMLPPAGEHKTLWCDEAMGVADYIVPLNLRGGAYVFFRRTGDTLAHWVCDRLPAGLRSVLARRLLKL